MLKHSEKTITVKYIVLIMLKRNESLIEAINLLKKALSILQPQYIYLPLKASATTLNGFFS